MWQLELQCHSGPSGKDLFMMIMDHDGHADHDHHADRADHDHHQSI